jgi:hypothetical protein
MRRLCLVNALSILIGCLAVCARPALADCVSCGPGGECFAASPGFSANCECRTRVVNGVATCKPSGICDPNDPTSCQTDQFPQLIASRAHLSTPFLNDLAQVNPLLAGAVWAGIAEANTALKADRAEVKGTMGRKGGSYSYHTQVQILEDGSASLKIHVQRDGAERGQDYEGTVAADGRSGQFVQVRPKGSSPVFSWGSN